MISTSSLIFGEDVHAALREHLFPGDGLEASAVLLCTRFEGERTKILVKDWFAVPYDACANREVDAVTWPGSYIEHAIDVAEKEGLTVLLTHSHPGGYLDFSTVDDESDAQSISSLINALGGSHGSAIMVHSGEMRARLYDERMDCSTLDLVSVVGQDIRYWWSSHPGTHTLPMAYTSGMTGYLSRLTVGVIGVSGTGSIVAELAARLGFGRVLLIDHDCVERKNLNRILNSTLADAEQKKAKVTMFAEAIGGFREGDVAIPINGSIVSREAVLAAAEVDVLFSCVDTKEARMVADRLASAFLIPLFDVGVTIPTYKGASGQPAIVDVAGRIDYVRPGGPTLRDRGVWTPEQLYAEHLQQTDKDRFEEEVERGYIKGVQEEAPSVITLNMRAASACVSEFIARVFPFREESNSRYVRTTFSLSGCEEDHYVENTWSTCENQLLATAGGSPLLGMPQLGKGVR